MARAVEPWNTARLNENCAKVSFPTNNPGDETANADARVANHDVVRRGLDKVVLLSLYNHKQSKKKTYENKKLTLMAIAARNARFWARAVGRVR